MSPEPDSERSQASLARLGEVLKDIAESVDRVSTWRCPYKNAQEHCTASFGCRNQSRTELPGELAICTGSDKLDYRSAWER